jgi:hypothetical protein
VTATCGNRPESSATELRNGSCRGRLPDVRAQIVRRLVENYGLPIAHVARQVGISTFEASKILPRDLSATQYRPLT